MTEYLDLEDLLDTTREAIGADAVVRDYGLLESALAAGMPTRMCTSRPPRCCTVWHATTRRWTQTCD
jgi:hypothetical protein